MIDVKLTETNLWSVFPFGHPQYVNAQARVSIEQETSTGGAEPFAEPLPTPNSMTATLVNEQTNETVGPCHLDELRSAHHLGSPQPRSQLQ